MNHFDWNTLYLTCFGLGLLLSVLSFLTGALHLHLGHFRFGHAHGQHSMSPLNAFTLTGFLCWFGGAGYLLNRANIFAAIAVLGLAIVSGLAGAGLLMWFLVGVLLKHERTLEPADTEIVGMLGKVSQPVIAGGVGEMLYTQNGSRRSAAIRSDDGLPIEKGAEVVVMSYTRGIGRVKRWSEFEHGLMGGDASEGVSSEGVR